MKTSEILTNLLKGIALMFLCFIEFSFIHGFIRGLFNNSYPLGGHIILFAASIAFAIPIFFIVKSFRENANSQSEKNKNSFNQENVEKTFLNQKAKNNFTAYRDESVQISIPYSEHAQATEDISETVKPLVGYIEDSNMVFKTDNSPITDKEIPYLVQLCLEKKVQQYKEHEQGLHNAFTEHSFSNDEYAFFSALTSSLEANKLNPHLLKLDKLSGGTWNVIYGSGYYIGKIRLLTTTATPNKYAVMKNGQARALRVFDTIDEAQNYIESTGGDEIQVRAGQDKKLNTYMQYFIGMGPVHELHDVSVDECITTIHRWIKYIKYCKRN